MKESFFQIKKNSILYKAFLPMLLVMMLQSALFMLVITQGSVVERLNQNAYDIFGERVSSRTLTLSSEMTRWSQLDTGISEISALYGSYLSQQGLTTETFSSSRAAMEGFLGVVGSNLVFLLRQNGVNGIFLILNGTDGEQIPAGGASQTKTGILIRDMDATSGYTDDTDLQLERAPSSVASQLGYALSAFWAPSFEFSDVSEGAFFYQTMQAPYIHPDTDPKDLGYWSGPHCVSGSDAEVISYSVPLFDENGIPYGVLGIEVTTSYLASMLPNTELGDASTGIYLLVRPTGEPSQFQTQLYSGFSYQTTFGNTSSIALLPDEVAENCYQIDNTGRIESYGSLHYLNLYSENSPFLSEQMAILGVLDGETLFSFNQEVRSSLLLSAITSLIVGILGILFVSRHFANPITKLSQRVQNSASQEDLVLEESGILEIDQLLDSIKSLSSRVAENAMRLSTIIRMTGIPIGAFELDLKLDTVYVTEEFFSIVDVFTQEDQAQMKTAAMFLQKMEQLRAYITTVDEPDVSYVCHFAKDAPGEKWVRFRKVARDDTILGVAIDCSAEFIEKLQISHERDHDILTGLYNRRAFYATLGELFQHPEDLGTGAIVMMDIDNLKYVNDTYGHVYGDAYIKTTAAALQALEEKNILLARMSGDEFIMFIHHRGSKDEIDGILEQIKEKIAQAFFPLPNEPRFYIQLSGGIAFYPHDSTDPHTLIKYADFAMYEVKKTTKGAFLVFDLPHYQKDNYLLQNQVELSRLLENNLVDYALQPIISLDTGRIFAFEALMRPQDSSIKTPTAVLVPARAEGRLYQVEHLTWTKTIEKFSDLSSAQDGHCKLFINSVPQQILTEEDYTALTLQFGPLLQHIVLDLPKEDWGDDEKSVQKRAKLRSWGVALALDDDNTGFHTQTILDGLDPDYIKIGMAAVRQIDKDPGRQTAVLQLLQYAMDRGIPVVGKGVETEAEFAFLANAGVKLLQGNLIQAPAPEACPLSDETEALIARHKRDASLPGQEI